MFRFSFGVALKKKILPSTKRRRVRLGASSPFIETEYFTKEMQSIIHYIHFMSKPTHYMMASRKSHLILS